MNSEITRSSIKGSIITSITIWPSDSVEREFFNALFKGEVIFHLQPNSDKVIITNKSEPYDAAIKEDKVIPFQSESEGNPSNIKDSTASNRI